MRKTLVFLLLAAACGGLPSADAGADLRSRSVPLPARVIPVPLVQQKTDYSCGDVATLALLRYWNHEAWKEVGEKALYGPLGTTAKGGTEPQAIADFLNAQPGLSAEVQDTTPQIADLEAAVDRGEPPIVDVEAWQNVASVKDLKPWATDWIDGHYVVLIAYDDTDFFFMDPSTGRHYAYIPRSDLAARWHDVVGKRNVKTQHLVIFVRGSTEAWTPSNPLPPKATPID
jgi:predicted double-glycine peptidase